MRKAMTNMLNFIQQYGPYALEHYERQKAKAAGVAEGWLKSEFDYWMERGDGGRYAPEVEFPGVDL